MRLDAAVAAQLHTTRAHAKQLILDGNVSIQGEVKIKPSALVENDIHLDIINQKGARPEVHLEAVYDDSDIKVVIKPAGMLVHPTSAHQEEGTVVDAILADTTDDDPVRPGIVHRLDRNTSGLIVLAKSKAAKEYMQKQFQDRNIQKTYLALVIGHLDQDEAIIKVPLGRSKTHPLKRIADPDGKDAITAYRVIDRIGNYDLVEAKPSTGRTHQLRAHFAYLGHPIAGDKLYGADSFLSLGRYFLHAAKLEFVSPNNTKVNVEAPLPKELEALLQKIRSRV
jgi:23S rRNA pseudouridine1911/1915/1917 synthase